MNDSTYVAGSTEVNGLKTGWRLIRVPLSDFEKIQDISLSEIKSVRLVAVSYTHLTLPTKQMV